MFKLQRDPVEDFPDVSASEAAVTLPAATPTNKFNPELQADTTCRGTAKAADRGGRAEFRTSKVLVHTGGYRNPVYVSDKDIVCKKTVGKKRKQTEKPLSEASESPVDEVLAISG